MWLRLFLEKFAEATRSATGLVQDLKAVERLGDGPRERGEITAANVRAIQEDPHWTYAAWWPRLTDRDRFAVPLPSDLSSDRSRTRLVKALYAELKHIEVVSVVLRFVRPDKFGIISPPVLALLGGGPRRDHVTTYGRYTVDLLQLADHSNLPRAADVDMALWSAAHLSLDPKYAEITAQMQRDPVFQRLRLRNALHNLDSFRQWTDEDRLLLAEGLLPLDHLVAANITAFAFESTCRTIADNLDHPLTEVKADSLKRLDGKVSILGIEEGTLMDLWGVRRHAVHGNPHLLRREAARFVGAVQELLHAARVRARTTRTGVGRQ